MRRISIVVLAFWIMGTFFSQESISLHLLNIGAVETFDKVELGIGLPEGIEKKIQNYTQNQSPISYDNQDNSFLNPFDPKQIDVQVEFWSPKEGGRVMHYKRFGFYYDAFSVSNGKVISSKTSSKIRVRFTPKEIGSWKCKAIVIVRGDTLSSPVLDFECVASINTAKGFLEISANQKYFEVQDSVFFPVGQNVPWPGSIWYNGSTSLPHKDFESYLKLINHLKESGGNYYRMLISPWTYDIEFENLGNYSSRMQNAWELDRLINFSEEKELKIHFDMLLHGVLENPSVYTITNWDWPAYESPVYGEKRCVSKDDKGYCYARELGLEHPVEFFTDEEAKRFYKNKLRYVIARWGYSTSIGVFELISEINNLGQQANLQFNGRGCPNVGSVTVPYKDILSVPKIVMGWQNEMAKYIKNELQHNNHPIAVSYTGRPNVKKGDFSYYSPYVDIATYNAYSFHANQRKLPQLSSKLNKYRNNKLLISNSGLNKDISDRSIALDKPFMLSEIGSGSSPCAQSSVWKQSVFLSPFTGLAGVSMPWNNYDDRRNLWHYFKGINSFMNSVALNKNFWVSNYLISKSKEVEVFSLQDAKSNTAIGVINNRTYNYYTMRDTCSECYCSKFKVDSVISKLEVISNSTKENRLKLNNLGMLNKYAISWYNPLVGKYIGEKVVVKTNLFGQVKLNYPTLEKEETPFIYFKLEKQ